MSSEEYEYSADGVNITSLCTKDNTGNVLSQELYTYDKMGNMLSVQNINGTESFEYDSLGRVKKEIHPDGTAKTIFYEWLDRSFSIKNELSAKVEYFHNAAGLLSSIEEWFPDSSVYNMYYDTMGNLNHVVDRRGNHTYITNDILGRQTKVSYPRLNSSVENSTEVKYHDVFWDNDIKCSIRIIISPSDKISCEYYDVYGRKYKTALIKNYEDFTASDFDNITSVPADAELMVTGAYVYDNFDRLIEEYDGENRKTAYTYDVLGNVLSKTTGTGPEALTVSYEYDSAGRCVKMIQGGNHITTYEYDRAGRLIKTTDPMNFTETYTYDTAGNVLTSKDKNGTITTNTYDNRGRLSKIQKGNQSIEYTYDAADNLLTSKDSSGTITYEYNADSTLKKKTYPDGKSITYSKYDKDKRPLEFVDYFGNTTAYTYDAHGNIASIGEKYSGSSSYKNTTYTYNQDDTLSKVNIPNNMTVQYTYDYAGRVTKLKNYTPYMSSYSDHLYEYDNSNNIVKSTETMFGHDTITTTYTYDSVNRLKREDGTNWWTYSYDEYNNIRIAVGSGDIYYTYDANNRLIKMQDWWAKGETADGDLLDDWQIDFTYDNNGKLLYSSKNSAPDCYGYTSNQKNYSYNVWGQLTGFSDSLGESAEYTYYSDGLRSSRKVGSTTYKYYYNGDKVVNETKNGSNFATNVYGVDGPISRQYSGLEHYYYKNVHGDVIFAFTSNHWRSSEYSYAAYGEEDTSYDYYSSNPNPLRYSGEYLDTESGMTYLRARYYDPYQRRFISEDPAKDGLNWYAYCGNNPVMRVDISGLEWAHIRELAQSLVDTGTIYSGGVTYTATNRNSVKVKIGEGYYYKTGEFYYNGDAEIQINRGRSTYTEHISENIQGNLYMERTDFYRAMNINYNTGMQTFNVTDIGNGMQRLVATAVTGGLTATANWGVGVGVGFVAGEIVGHFQFEPGEYEVEYILGEVYNQATNRYEYIQTTTYYKMATDDKGNLVRTVYSSISKYNLSSEESLL